MIYGNSNEIKVTVSTTYEDISLSKIKDLDIEYWRKLVDELYENCKDEEGFYNCNISLYKSKNRRFFNIDHIIPMKHGGKTKLDNLQVIARWENIKKGTKIDKGLKYEEINCYLETNEKDNDYIKQRLEKVYNNDESNIDYLNFKSIIALKEEKYRTALIFANKALKIDKYNIVATKNKGLAYYYKGNKDVGINLLENIYTNKVKDDFEILCLIGEYYYKKNRINDALVYYSMAYDINNTDYNCIFKIARIYERKNKKDEANKYYDKISNKK